MHRSAIRPAVRSPLDVSAATRRSTPSSTLPAPEPEPGPLARWRHRRARAAAERRALAAFAAMHPDWHRSLFDATFLARPDVREAAERGDAVAMARAWTRQFRYRDERRRERDVRILTGPAGDYLALLEEALRR